MLLSIGSFMYLLEVNLSGLGYGLHLYAFQAKSIKVNSALLLVSAMMIIPFGAGSQEAVILRLACTSIFLIWYLKNLVMMMSFERIGASLSVLKQQIRFGGRNWIQNLIGLLNAKGNVFILAAVAGNTSLGLYSVAILFAECIRILPDTVGTLLLPKLVATSKTESPSETTARILRVTLALVSLISVLMIPLVSNIIRMLFGTGYEGSIICAVIIIPGAALGCVYQLLTRYFTSQYEQQHSIRAASLGLVVTGCVTFALAPRYGAAGAASGYTLASFCTSFMLLKSFSRNTTISIKSLLIPTSKDIHQLIRILH